MTMMEEWKLSHLRADPRNKELFEDISGDDFNSLVTSIKDVGQIAPIMITPTGLIICGHQRYRALKAAHAKVALVVIKPVDDDDEQMLEKLRIEEQLRR